MLAEDFTFSARRPRVVRPGFIDAAAASFRDGGWSVARADIAMARDSSDVVTAIDSVLPLPDYCGATWDSLLDVVDDVAVTWSFPVLLLVSGIDVVMRDAPEFAAEMIYRTMQFADGVAFKDVQFEILFGLAA